MLCEVVPSKDSVYDNQYKVTFSLQDFRDLTSLDLYTREQVQKKLRETARKQMKEFYDERTARYS